MSEDYDYKFEKENDWNTESKYITCPRCNGFGEIHKDYDLGGYWTNCPACGGEGCLRK